MKNIVYLSALIAGGLFMGCNRNGENGAGGGGDTRATSSESVSNSYVTAPTDNTGRPPDNTGKNVRDRSDNTLTPGDQGENQADLELTRRIRRAITSNDQLSADGKNIKVITLNGKVTLRGPVKSEEEKKSLSSIAQQAAGAPVTDELEVKTSNQQ